MKNPKHHTKDPREGALKGQAGVVRIFLSFVIIKADKMCIFIIFRSYH